MLHFVGHGTYDVDTDEGLLAFVGRGGRAEYVTASSLADLLDEAEPTPRLVVLNSCQSGAGGPTDLFSGTAAALAHSGIRAVAAMQFSISDIAAIEFARGFYTALAHGRGIDEAVRSGRIGILGIEPRNARVGHPRAVPPRGRRTAVRSRADAAGAARGAAARCGRCRLPDPSRLLRRIPTHPVPTPSRRTPGTSQSR